jgi:hypothetical protein
VRTGWSRKGDPGAEVFFSLCRHYLIMLQHHGLTSAAAYSNLHRAHVKEQAKARRVSTHLGCCNSNSTPCKPCRRHSSSLAPRKL